MMKQALLLTAILISSLSAIAQQKKLNQQLADSLAKWTVLDQAAAGMPSDSY